MERGNETGGFFSFRRMISSTLIQILYVLGAIGITIAGVIPILWALAAREWGGLLWGGGILILGNLLWRVLCELGIVVFSIHENTTVLRNEVGALLSDFPRSLQESLASITQELNKGVLQLAAIEEELREGVSYANLRETFAAVAEQLERGAAQFVEIGQELKEGISHAELREALRSIAAKFEEGSARLAQIEQELKERRAQLPPSEPEPSSANLMEAEPQTKGWAESRRLRVRWGLVLLILLLLLAGAFVGFPIAGGPSRLQSLDPQALHGFLTGLWDYWVQVVKGGG